MFIFSIAKLTISAQGRNILNVVDIADLGVAYVIERSGQH